MEELVQYIIVNKDLEMSPGKIAAQVGHVCTICTYQYLTLGEDKTWCQLKNVDKDKFNKWYKGDQKKIVLHAHQKELEKLVDAGFIYIHDNGLTEIPAGSLTVVSLGIMSKEEAKPLVKRFQLLK